MGYHTRIHKPSCYRWLQQKRNSIPFSYPKNISPHSEIITLPRWWVDGYVVVCSERNESAVFSASTHLNKPTRLLKEKSLIAERPSGRVGQVVIVVGPDGLEDIRTPIM